MGEGWPSLTDSIVRIAAVRLHPYALPLRQPWVAAAVTLRLRRGMLIEIRFNDGVVGWGDCAPLPSSGDDGHLKAFTALAAAAKALLGLEGEAPTVPEVRWAVETALFDAAARRCGVSLARFLNADASDRVEVNAALGALVAEDCGERAERAVAEGFGVAKIKMGVAPVADEIAALRAVAWRCQGRLRLRLDANQAWSEPQALRVLEAISDLPIDGIEEPLAAPTLEALARVQGCTAFAIAVDESLPTLGIDAVFEVRPVRRLVVKPARLGGITITWDLARKARDAGIELVLTSVVDSAVGVTAAAHLAAALPCSAVHGLGTLSWLTTDVASPPVMTGGGLRLPAGAGLGLVLGGDATQG